MAAGAAVPGLFFTFAAMVWSKGRKGVVNLGWGCQRSMNIPPKLLGRRGTYSVSWRWREEIQVQEVGVRARFIWTAAAKPSETQARGVTEKVCDVTRGLSTAVCQVDCAPRPLRTVLTPPDADHTHPASVPQRHRTQPPYQSGNRRCFLLGRLLRTSNIPFSPALSQSAQ